MLYAVAMHPARNISSTFALVFALLAVAVFGSVACTVCEHPLHDEPGAAALAQTLPTALLAIGVSVMSVARTRRAVATLAPYPTSVPIRRESEHPGLRI